MTSCERSGRRWTGEGSVMKQTDDERESGTTLRQRADGLTAGEELRSDRGLLRCLIDSASDLIYIKDRDSVYLGCNKASEAFMGMPESEQIGKTDFDFFDREIAEAIRKIDRQVLEEGKPHRIEEWVTDQNGAMVLMETLKAPYYCPDGEVLGLVGISRDITESKRAEEERLAGLRFFESMDRVNRAIQRTNDLEQMMSDVLDSVLSIFGCDRAYLMYPCDPEAESWVIPMERTTPDYRGAKAFGVDLSKDARVARKLRLLLSSDGPVNMGPGTPYMFSGTTAEHFNIRSMMAMAVYPKVGKPWEFGIHQCSYGRVWNPEEERLFQEIGRRLADALSSLVSHRDLLESEAKYRRIVDTANEGIWMLGEDLLTTFVNGRMAEMIGYRAEEMIGRSLTYFICEEDAPDHHERMEKRRHGVSEHYELRFRHRNGETVWTQASAVPILDAAENFKGTFGMVTDITERKQMEQALRVREREYRTLVENIPDLIVRYDPQLRRTYVNPAWEEASGLAAGEVINVPVADIPRVPKPAVAEYVDKLRLALETGTLQAMEFTWVNARGVTLYLDYIIVPEYDQHGKVVSVLAVGHDITERKRAEEALNLLNEELEQRVQERTVELEAKNTELERMNRLFVGRELRMMELKERIRKLESKSGGGEGDQGALQ